MRYFSETNLFFSAAEYARLDFWANAILLGFAGLVFYPPLKLIIGTSYKGKWRDLALLPVVVTVPALVFLIFQIWQESNQWIWVTIVVMPVAVIYLVIIVLARRIELRFNSRPG